jgi:glyoxylase-like metal-dependent hydrolase (beta-lactamase superfamily II)
MLRRLLAPNASPMTLDGTLTWLVGARTVAIIDPGPADAGHLDAIAAEVGDSEPVILLTHGHPDHAAGASTLAGMLRCTMRSVARGDLAEGDVIATDAGALVALRTPGHTPDHVSFHWPSERAAFVGDLMMGGLDTALVAAPEGSLHDYLASLERLRALQCRVLHPAHGPSFDAPDDAIDAYVAHRRSRETQVLDALAAGPLDDDAIVDAVYGDALHADLHAAARGSVRAYLDHLARAGRVRRSEGGRWARSGPAEEG